MASIDELRSRYPGLPRAYFQLLTELDGWEGFVGDTYVVLFGAARARTASDEYQISKYRPGLVVIGSNGGGELIVCPEGGPEDRPISLIAAVGMADAELLPLAPSTTRFARDVLAAAAERHRQ